LLTGNFTLLAETKFLYESPVSGKVAALQVFQETPALPDENDESPGAIGILLEGFAVFGELQNPFRRKRNLNLDISGVLFVRTEFGNHRGGFFFCKCHYLLLLYNNHYDNLNLTVEIAAASGNNSLPSEPSIAVVSVIRKIAKMGDRAFTVISTGYSPRRGRICVKVLNGASKKIPEAFHSGTLKSSKNGCPRSFSAWAKSAD
jgi:hypothetical protein